MIEKAIEHFERICRPKYVSKITTRTIDAYVSARRQETADRSRKAAKNPVEVATCNKETRHLRVVLRTAHEWGYPPKVPKFRMLKEPQRLPRYITPEHFVAIYGACDVAKRPAETGQEYAAVDWWRSLVTFAYLTGWRIGEILALRWDDVSLDEGFAITRAEDNKGGRDEKVPLHPLVVDHLRRIVSFGTPGNLVFYWPHRRRRLWDDFAKIQEAGGIHLQCARRHEHGPHCRRYGFHDFRRGFASMNALELGGDALKAMMRHKSYTTTQRYINMADGLKGITDKLFVPTLPTVRGADNDE